MTPKSDAQTALRQRRELNLERQTAVSAALDRLDGLLSTPTDQPLDAGHRGSLRSAVQALLVLAARQPGFDATVSVGQQTDTAIRVRHLDSGLHIGPADGSDDDAAAAAGRVLAPPPPEAALSRVSELAELLRSGQVRSR